MAYYTERHGLRKPVVKTYDISIERSTLCYSIAVRNTMITLRGSILRNAPMGRGVVELTRSSLV